MFTVDTSTGAVAVFTDGGERPFVTPNFAAVAADGTVYVSDSNEQGEPGGGVYRFAPDGTGGLWSAAPLDFANGLALAPDGSAVFVVESFRPGREPDPDRTRRRGRAVGTGGGVAGHGSRRHSVRTGRSALHRVLRAEPGAARGPRGGEVETVLADPTAHLLCHPTNLAFRGDELFTSNLGRWHVTLIDQLEIA